MPFLMLNWISKILRMYSRRYERKNWPVLKAKKPSRWFQQVMASQSLVKLDSTFWDVFHGENAVILSNGFPENKMGVSKNNGTP